MKSTLWLRSLLALAIAGCSSGGPAASSSSEEGGGGSGGNPATGGTPGKGGSGGNPATGGTQSGGSGGNGGAGEGGSTPDAAAKPDTAPPRDVAPADAPAFETGKTLPPPPDTWMEHWFEHNQLVKLVDYDDHVAIYFDDDVPRQQVTWILPFISKLWQYAKAHYGDMGMDPRLYSIHHQGRYSGGHPSYYFDASHDRRNVSDVGPGPWNPGSYDIASHEIAHVVESTNFGTQGSPSFPVWHDSKWAEIFQYDIYLGVGLPQEAQRVHTRFTNTTDDFPRPGTRWFRDWYFPLWRDRGGVDFLAKYFQLLAMHFPKNGKRYSRDLNFGEYVHFMCGAAGMDCKPMAIAAFGNAWEAQYQKARTDFPGVTY